MIQIPEILLKFLTMHGKAKQVCVRPELVLKHFGERVPRDNEPANNLFA